MNVEEKSRALLADAACWRLLSLFFQRPFPDRFAEMRDLSLEVGDPDLFATVQSASGAREGEYLAWLGPGGAIAPREPAFQPLQDPGRLLADLSGFYRAFAYHPEREDPPDHIATELGFVGFLRLKEAYAWKAGRPGDAELASRALHGFVTDHLAPFLEAFRDRLIRLEAPDHLQRAANIAFAKTRKITRLVAITPP